MAKKWSEIRRKRFSETEVAELDRQIHRELVEMSLADLRRELGLTQEELARSLEIDQTQVSRIEHRADHLISTLRRCVRALGGDIEVLAVVGDKRVKLSV
jgi:transcriptional regulator